MSGGVEIALMLSPIVACAGAGRIWSLARTWLLYNL